MRFSIQRVQGYRPGYPGGTADRQGKHTRWQRLWAVLLGMLVALWGVGCGDDEPKVILTDGDDATEQEAEADGTEGEEAWDDPWEDIAGGMEPIDGDADPEPEIDEEEYILDGDMAMYRVAK